MFRARFCFADRGRGFLDLRAAAAFARRACWRLLRWVSRGSGDEGRRSRGRFWIFSRKIWELVVGEWARDSRDRAACSFSELAMVLVMLV